VLAGLTSRRHACLQVIPGLVPKVDFESAETLLQPFEGPHPSLWLLLLLWQPLGLILASETGFEGAQVLSDCLLAVLLLKRSAPTQNRGFLKTILGSGNRNIGSCAFSSPGR